MGWLRLGDLFSSGSDKISGIGNNSIFTSPLWTAIIQTIVILCIVWFIMNNEVDPRYEDTTLMTLMIKIGIWSFITLGVIGFISHGAVASSVEGKYLNKNQQQIVERVTGQGGIENVGQIKPQK